MTDLTFILPTIYFSVEEQRGFDFFQSTQAGKDLLELLNVPDEQHFHFFPQVKKHEATLQSVIGLDDGYTFSQLLNVGLFEKLNLKINNQQTEHLVEQVLQSDAICCLQLLLQQGLTHPFYYSSRNLLQLAIEKNARQCVDLILTHKICEPQWQKNLGVDLNLLAVFLSHYSQSDKKQSGAIFTRLLQTSIPWPIFTKKHARLEYKYHSVNRPLENFLDVMLSLDVQKKYVDNKENKTSPPLLLERLITAYEDQPAKLQKFQDFLNEKLSSIHTTLNDTEHLLLQQYKKTISILTEKQALNKNLKKSKSVPEKINSIKI